MFNTFELPLSADILRGAAEIAEHLFGEKGKKRKVYYLVERNSLPVFRVGCMMCARKSTLAKWIAAQERQHPSTLSLKGEAHDGPEAA
jgi:hypothetical protein